MLIGKPPDIPSSAITSKDQYLNRRRFLRGAVSGAVYLPLELYKLWEGITWLRVAILVSNCLVVFYLTQLLVRRQACPPAAANSPVAPVGP